MHLLHVSCDGSSNEPLNVTLCWKTGVNIPPYAILSHRWRVDEVLYADITHPYPAIPRSRAGWKKLENTCRKALEKGFEYVWIDTCCIDKNSSVELSEAINSMYRYYAETSECFAFLDDVEGLERGDLESSCWFTRGWILQELIAPKHVLFYSKDWKPLGTKDSLCVRLAAAWGIYESVIKDPMNLDAYNISDKMNWASRRETTREEDESYSLLGIFRVSLPPLYREGRERAFRRLQIEIMTHSIDHTLFAWFRRTNAGDMLAPSVRNFWKLTKEVLVQIPHEKYLDQFPADRTDRDPTLDYSINNAGLHIELPLFKMPDSNNIFLAILACRVKSSKRLVAIFIQRQSSGNMKSRYQRVCLNEVSVVYIPYPGLSQLNGTRISCQPTISHQHAWISKNANAFDATLIRRGNAMSIPRCIATVITLRSPPEAKDQITHGFYPWGFPGGFCAQPRRGDFKPLILKASNECHHITVAVREVNDSLYVFFMYEEVAENTKTVLDQDSFKIPGGYAFRRFRRNFTYLTKFMGEIELGEEPGPEFIADLGYVQFVLNNSTRRLDVALQPWWRESPTENALSSLLAELGISEGSVDILQ